MPRSPFRNRRTELTAFLNTARAVENAQANLTALISLLTTGTLPTYQYDTHAKGYDIYEFLRTNLEGFASLVDDLGLAGGGFVATIGGVDWLSWTEVSPTSPIAISVRGHYSSDDTTGTEFTFNLPAANIGG